MSTVLYQRALYVRPLYRYGATILVAAVLSSLWFFWWYAPLSDNMLRMRAGLQATAQQRSLVNRSPAESSADTLAQSRESFTSFQEKLPLERALSSLMEMIAEYSEQSEVTLYSSTFDQESQRDWYIQVPLKLLFSGTQKQIASFFARMAQSQRLISFESVDIARRGKERFDVVAHLNIYLIPGSIGNKS